MTYQTTGQSVEYNPVWISTIEHMTQYSDAYAKASVWDKGRGSYDVPDDYPYIDFGFTRILNVFLFFMLWIMAIVNSFLGGITFYFFTFLAILYSISFFYDYSRGKAARKVPVPYFSSGIMKISDSTISFRASSFSLPLFNFHNMKWDLDFELDHSQVERIERVAPHEVFKGLSGFF